MRYIVCFVFLFVSLVFFGFLVPFISLYHFAVSRFILYPFRCYGCAHTIPNNSIYVLWRHKYTDLIIELCSIYAHTLTLGTFTTKLRHSLTHPHTQSVNKKIYLAKRVLNRNTTLTFSVPLNINRFSSSCVLCDIFLWYTKFTAWLLKMFP